MEKIKTLDKETLLDLLHEYDLYIQDANEERKYEEGWYPVCISEFYDCEYQEILQQRGM